MPTHPYQPNFFDACVYAALLAVCAVVALFYAPGCGLDQSDQHGAAGSVAVAVDREAVVHNCAVCLTAPWFYGNFPESYGWHISGMCTQRPFADFAGSGGYRLDYWGDTSGHTCNDSTCDFTIRKQECQNSNSCSPQGQLDGTLHCQCNSSGNGGQCTFG